MSPPRDGRHAHEFAGADDVDAAIGAIFEPKDAIASNQPVLDDPIKVSANDLFGAAWSHASSNPKLAGRSARGDPCGQRVGVAASESDFCQVESRHVF